MGSKDVTVTAAERTCSWMGVHHQLGHVSSVSTATVIEYKGPLGMINQA